MAAANTKKHKHTKRTRKHTYNYEGKKEKKETTNHKRILHIACTAM